MMRAKVASRALALLAAAFLTGCGFGGPAEPLFTLTGSVEDSSGQPLPGAVVTDGQVSVLTDEGGRYSLALFQTQVRIKKPGFAAGSGSAEAGKTLNFQLSPSGKQERVAIDRRSVGDRLTGLKGFLQQEGHAVVDYAPGSLGSYDVVMLVTPGSLTEGESQKLRDWVRSGGRLILAGEWGGYPSQDLNGLNALAGDAGITFTGATIKQATPESPGNEWLSVQGVSPASLGSLVGPEALYLFTSTSLSLKAPAKPVFTSDRRAYSVLAGTTGPQIVGAVGASGLGKVFALGDSSLWLDEDSEQIGTPNWQRGANGQLADAFIQW